MSVTTDKIAEFNVLDGQQPESTDPAYLAWRDEKVRAALADAKAHPQHRVSQSEVWKKFGLET